MNWIVLSVKTTAAGADTVSALLMSCGAKGTQIVDRADIPDADRMTGFGELIDADLAQQMPTDVLVKAWYASPEEARQAITRLAALKHEAFLEAGELSVSEAEAKDEDWAENWKQYYKPMRVGKRLVVKPSWEVYKEQAGDLVIHMDPGMAFGTGTHETTRLCLEMIEQHYKGGPALDIGTGSGILAVALARIGSGPVLAVDIDPVAVKSAGENVKLNVLTERVQVKQGDLALDIAGRFSFISANILADVVISLAEPVKTLLTKNGLFLASGIIRDREEDVREAYLQAGYYLHDSRVMGEWVAFLFGLPNA
jgi:ribosomal protein L11 methyltransferase